MGINTDENKHEEHPKFKPFSHLGIPGALAALLKPPSQQKPPTLSPLQPGLFKRSEGVPTLAGLVSWGLGCARPDYPGVYTDIRFSREWIIEKKILKNHPRPVSIPFIVTVKSRIIQNVF